jgi:haloacetate dehalogenase
MTWVTSTGIRRAWAADLRGHEIQSGHHMAEEVPKALADELRRFILEAIPAA